MVAYRPQKKEKNRARLTVGGNLINYSFNVSSPTADLPTIKLLWNSVLSTKDARFFTLDISNFYLGTPMERTEFMRLNYKLLPLEIVNHYKLNKKVNGGWVHIRIAKGMYGLPQAALLTYKQLRSL